MIIIIYVFDGLTKREETLLLMVCIGVLFHRVNLVNSDDKKCFSWFLFFSFLSMDDRFVVVVFI